jgi:hypothetical protein
MDQFVSGTRWSQDMVTALVARLVTGVSPRRALSRRWGRTPIARVGVALVGATVAIAILPTVRGGLMPRLNGG